MCLAGREQPERWLGSPGGRQPSATGHQGRISNLQEGFVGGALSGSAAARMAAFTLLVLADALAGTPVIVAAHKSDVWLGGMGLLMTGIAATAIIARPKRTYLWLGIDSLALVAIYALAIAALPRLTS